MATNGESLIEPIISTAGTYKVKYSGGLTKREHFAAMAMQGLCSMDDKGTYSSLNDATNDLARTSVEIADALINALNK